MMNKKYDVFISYSRKDYLDEQKNVIPGNVVSKIKDALAKSDITYWFDEDGIFSGQNFVEKIINNIDNSHIFVFLSSENANNSRWTCKEIACADELEKTIIPVRIDKSSYNKKILFRISDLDYIEYYTNPENAIDELVHAIKAHLDQLKNNPTLTDSIISVDKISNMKGIEFFDALRTHILNKQTLRIKYMSFKASLPKDIMIFPYLLKEFRHRWYLIGSKPNSKELEKLALDRMVSIEIDKFTQFCDNDSVDVYHFFDDTIGLSKSSKSEPEKIWFWVSKNRYKYLETKPIHTSQKKIKKTSDGGSVFEIRVIINFELYSTFLSYGADLIVLSPQKVVQQIPKILNKAIGLYADKSFKRQLDLELKTLQNLKPRQSTI